MKYKMKEDSEAMQEEVSNVGESNKKNDEAQGKTGQQPSTLLASKRCEDKEENEAGEFLGTQNARKRHEASKEKKKLRMDEAQKFHEKEEEK